MDYKKISNRELQVLRLAALENGEIANILNIGKTTVKQYFERAFVKLGVTNRRQAIIKVLRLGLMKPEQFIVGYTKE